MVGDTEHRQGNGVIPDHSTNRALRADDLGGITSRYPTMVPASGVYTVRQKSSSRFMTRTSTAASISAW